MADATYDRLVTLLVDVMGLEDDEVRPSSTFSELDVDSLAMVELVLAAQKEFGVEIGEDDLTPEMTIEQTAQFLEAKAVPTR
ncbi:acyl carrier protein [Kibdelosporangium aridum]|uniref:Acyl carrier protein n=1 Tax=Kibdelosporangium aridum TaxID=2030 RepID=A0A1W1ZLA0_KIBAR|nr:phosphopantetheine-binding protein [Kibdelosporangium aridum]SMC48821.1 acyl carrier protein [Kibdelosporangium aridum]